MTTNGVALQEPEFLSIEDLAARGWGKKSKIYDAVKRGEFPPPIKVGGVNRWLPEELEQHKATLIAQRDAELRKNPDVEG